MSIKDFNSVELSWITIAGVLNNGSSADKVSEYFDKAYPYAQEAINIVNSLKDVGTLSLKVSKSEIQNLHDRRRELLSFCNSIHYEAGELIDVPFGKSLSSIVEAAYNLDPKNITVKSTGLFGIPYSKGLPSVMNNIIEDSKLQKDFDAKVSNLNKDEIEDTLEDEIKNVLFWEKEYNKAHECQVAADEVFTDKVRADWNSFDEDTKKEYIEMYAARVNDILGEGRDIVDDYKVEKMGGFGYNSSSREVVAISDEFIKNQNTDITNYNIDKMIETITHETRHQYQHESSDGGFFNQWDVKRYKASDSVIADWNLPYQSTDKVEYRLYWEQPVENDARGFAALARSTD